MRNWVMGAVGVAVLLGAVTGVQADVGIHRSGTDAQRAAALRAEWDRDAVQGVPAALLDPLRARLTARGEAQWWSMTWWTTAPHSQLDRLEADTRVVWTTAVAAARGRAQQVVADAGGFLTQAGSLAPSG